MPSLQAELDEVAERTGFSGVFRVDRAGETLAVGAHGYADRAHRIPNTMDTVFGTASATKTFTALTVMALVEQGTIALDTSARSLLGEDLPLVADDVTVGHLLAHRSGIGDYFDENAVGDITDYVLTVPVHELDTTERYLRVLGGHPTVFPAGQGFAYNNAGYVLLALLAERASGTDYHRLVTTLVCDPAGLGDTAFLRSDELPGHAALGYLAVDGLRTNLLHLPVRGSGDGGVYTTAADLGALWDAILAGRVVSRASLAEMLRPHSDWPEESERYGLGFHLHETTDEAWMEGYDAGVSMFSGHQPASATTYTLIANWSQGAWPVMRLLSERL